MDLDAPGTNDGDGALGAGVDGQVLALDPSVIDEVLETVVSAEENESNTEPETTTPATDQPLDDAKGDAFVQPLETEHTKQNDDEVGHDESARSKTQEENGREIHVAIADSTLEVVPLASDCAAVVTSDSVLMQAIDTNNDQHEGDAVPMEVCDGDNSAQHERNAVLSEATADINTQHEGDAVPMEACGGDSSGPHESDAVLREAIADTSDQHESDAVLIKAISDESDVHESEAATKNVIEIEANDEKTVQSVEASGTVELHEMNAEVTIAMQQNLSMDDVPVGDLADHTDSAGPTASSVAIKKAHANSSGGQAEKDASVENAGDSAPSPSTHVDSEYDTSAPPTSTPSVPHGDDEYDPANPQSTRTSVATDTAPGFASHPSGTEQEEYDPDHPSMTSAAPTEPVAMEVDHTAESVGGELSTATPAKKRKTDGELNPPSDASANGTTDSKRPRCVDGDKSPRDDDHKHARRRCGSGDSTPSSSSKLKHHEEDHKGLSAAAWDRLMDFQTSGEFLVTQVSRAAFASVGAMPEFAQIAIIARFVRTPMRDIRDKNGQLMRIFRDYQKENPQIAVLQPVDAFISDYKSDPQLFRFGYAPPQPATGISNVQVPYQRDQPPKDFPAKNSPREARGTAVRSEPGQHQHKDVDEFGRAVHVNEGTAYEPNRSVRSANQRSVADPRLSSRNRQGLSSPSTPVPVTGGRAEAPRHRDQPHSQSSSGAGRDPRRRGSSISQHPSPRGVLPGPSQVQGSSDLYERLPTPVKAVVNSMRHEGRLQEPLNDNVVTRLLHLPERVALQAVENFSNVDLSQVENLQGFLVGIINRVNEKAIASEKQHRPQVPSPRRHPPSTIALSGNYGAPSQGGSVLGGPPQNGRLNSNNVANGGGYRGQPAPMATGSAPALYERPYDAQVDTRDPRRRQPVPQGPPQYGGVVQGPPSTGIGHGPIGMQSFTVLPMSVQNHVHALVENRTLSSLEELGGKCYEVLGQLSEPLANQVLTRFAGANLSNVRNKSGFLIGVVKRARQEYGFD